MLTNRPHSRRSWRTSRSGDSPRNARAVGPPPGAWKHPSPQENCRPQRSVRASFFTPKCQQPGLELLSLSSKYGHSSSDPKLMCLLWTLDIWRQPVFSAVDWGNSEWWALAGLLFYSNLIQEGNFSWGKWKKSLATRENCICGYYQRFISSQSLSTYLPKIPRNILDKGISSNKFTIRFWCLTWCEKQGM